MAALALKALSIGSEKIPDKAFHAIPGGYFRPPEVDEKKKSKSSSRKNRMHDTGDSADSRDDRRERHQHQRKSDDYSASESGSDSEDDTRRRKPRRPTHRHRRYTSSQNLERGYDSDGMTRDNYQQSRGMPPPAQPGPGGQYFAPPPTHAYEDGQAQPGADGAFDPVFSQPQYGSQGGQYYPQQVSATRMKYIISVTSKWKANLLLHRRRQQRHPGNRKLIMVHLDRDPLARLIATALNLPTLHNLSSGSRNVILSILATRLMQITPAITTKAVTKHISLPHSNITHHRRVQTKVRSPYKNPYISKTQVTQLL